MKRILIALSLLSAALSAADVMRLPAFTVNDQFGGKLSSLPLTRSNAVIAVYRVRESADYSQVHYAALQRAAGTNTPIIRIGDISKVPGFIHGFIITMFRNNEPDAPYYLDTDGIASASFSVPPGSCGFFIFTNGTAAYADVFAYTAVGMSNRFSVYTNAVSRMK
ncbi:MAG: hypothetical protein HZC28_01080 [Spirochaetes bacterium]|nr:hypothetical protein [Spirochaetota bacterium]